jgi:phosphoribosylglycinamide formyltransferase 2
MEEKQGILDSAQAFKKGIEARLTPLEQLNPQEPATFISVGGGELGDLAVTAAKTRLGGPLGGVRTVAFDRYQGFPAQDGADFHEVFDMMNGDLLEGMIRKYIPDPTRPHAIYLEIEKANTRRVCELGTADGYNVASTPFGPLICMDRHLTKCMFDRLGIPRVEWRYAVSQEEIEATARDYGLPVIVKPVMTSSGHGTSVIRSQDELRSAYENSLRHARGKGDEVIVERFLPELTEMGTEITQLVIRHFDEDGRLKVSFAPPIEHKRPGATYHESWLPATISDAAKERCIDGARKIADFIGGLGVYAVEQFVIGDDVYNNEVANRPHDTGMISRWALNMDEGAMMLYSTLGLQVTASDLRLSRSGYAAAHVVLAPDFGSEEERRVVSFGLNSVKRFITGRGLDGDIWYFGKKSAYSDRRMGLAVGFGADAGRAREVAAEIAHRAEQSIGYAVP